MVDLTIVSTNVVPGAGSNVTHGTAGEVITAGKLVYTSSTTGKLMLSDTNSVTVEARKPIGIALNGASINQPVTVHKSGEIVLGATIVTGDPYYASDTPGGICPRADVLTGENVVLVGVAKSTTVLAVDIQAPGVVL